MSHLVARCRTFRKLLSAECLMLPGAFNGMVARIAADLGYKGLYLSGAALTAGSGVPDIGLRSLDEFSRTIRELSTSSNLPILADADTGFGEGEMCARTVWEYFHAGATGLHIEDQVFPKRCGHLDGKQLVPTDVMAKKVAIAAKVAAQISEGQFVVCARTDAFGVNGLAQCIARSKAYVDAGADMIFPEGLATEEDFRKVGEALRGYGSRGGPFLLANMTEFGKTPYLHVDQFAKMGYHCVIYPVSTLRVAMKAVEGLLADLKAKGTQKDQLGQMQSRQELYDRLHYKPGREWVFPEASRKE